MLLTISGWEANRYNGRLNDDNYVDDILREDPVAKKKIIRYTLRRGGTGGCH